KGSSSSATAAAPPSSLSSNFYKVLLSFRGTDTRDNFVSHLYSALMQKGITTFKDDKDMERGKQIKLEILRAIRQSRRSL
ncbi:Disease resistance protein Roq1, partial [Linum grandiflorum]